MRRECRNSTGASRNLCPEPEAYWIFPESKLDGASTQGSGAIVHTHYNVTLRGNEPLVLPILVSEQTRCSTPVCDCYLYRPRRCACR